MTLAGASFTMVATDITLWSDDRTFQENVDQLLSLDPSYAPWSDRHDPVESTRQFGEGCVVLATCWVDLFTTFDWGRESQTWVDIYSAPFATKSNP